MAISEKFADESGEVTVLKPPLDMSRKAVVEKLLAVEPVLRERGVATLSLFGSVARDEATSDSDVDVFVEDHPGCQIGGYELISVELFLKDHLGCDVDVADILSLKGKFGNRVLSDAFRVF